MLPVRGEKGNLGARALYLCLQIKSEHGEAEVEHEVLGLEALQGTPHPECHHGLALDEDEGTDHIEGAHQQDQHKTGLRDTNRGAWPQQGQAGTWNPAGNTHSSKNLNRDCASELSAGANQPFPLIPAGTGGYSQCWTCRIPRNTGLCLCPLCWNSHSISAAKDGSNRITLI